MDTVRSLHFLVVGLFLNVAVKGALVQPNAKISTITRQNTGDIFTVEDKECKLDACVGISSGTAGRSSDGLQSRTCSCQCHSHLPAFREDLQICVDDIHECVLSPFVSSSVSQQIPFVFLPLKGQIIHPSKEISFAGIQTPVCAVSGAKFLTDGGWIDLRNPLDTDVPFRLFRDEGRTFLQWIGEPELRSHMGGRLVLIHLMCREIAKNDGIEASPPPVFTPCVAFRVVGTPTKYLSNISEVVFSADNLEEGGNGLSISEYVAIGICSVLLGLIYVASVFLYLYLRKRRRASEKILERRDKQSLGNVEDGVIKSNPLLNLGRHFSSDNNFSDSCSSDTDVPPDIIQNHDDRKKNVQVTSALIHPPQKYSFTHIQPLHQETIEKLPEENVSIVETLDCREDRPDSLKIMGTARRKLYFNPAYFEPHLLISPPPAAIEFLTKIREVISIAKQKMACKKFTPNLNGIPEEDTNYDFSSEVGNAIGSRRSSAISLKRENSRRKTCSGCPGCEPQDFKALSGKLPEFPSLGACQSCSATTSDSKQISIRKWLEDVPIISTNSNDSNTTIGSMSIIKCTKRIRSPTRSLSPDHITPIIRPSTRPSSERARSPSTDSRPGIKTPSIKSASSKRSTSTIKAGNICKKSIFKPKAPPPPIPVDVNTECDIISNIYDVIKEPERPLPPPDMIHEAIAVEETKIPTLTKQKMNAVICQLSTLDQLKVDSNFSSQVSGRSKVEYDTDSLERSRDSKGYSTPTDYADITSSQPSPSLSAALPLDEEMTMRNAVINTKTGNRTISKLNRDQILQQEEHDYELIVLKKRNIPDGIFKLPELLQRANGYSLVSEVYVNNGYNYSSAPSTPSESNSSTLERPPRIIYEENKPGHLLIEVQDCPDNYIKAEDSDDFEPDTLDRKPKMKNLKDLSDCEFIDSLERPNQILLRSTGSFKKETFTDSCNEQLGLESTFSSLREIYEAKLKKPFQNEHDCSLVKPNLLEEDFEGRMLTLEERHCKRQRKSPIAVPPDVIPPNSIEIPIYECPKPPRKVSTDNILKPPLPPKNGSIRGKIKESICSNFNNCEHGGNSKSTDVSFLQNFIHADDVLFKNGINNQIILQAATITTNPIDLQKMDSPKKSWHKIINPNSKPEDPGYLSTDSNESNRKKRKDGESETDESLGDGHSESGAESVETHSVFFGSFRKSSYVAGSIDSGVGSDIKPVEPINILEDIASSDSETMSYSTVVPFNNFSK